MHETVDLGRAGHFSVDRYGDAGPTVVLLHGIPGWRGTFAAVGARLGERHRVIVPDLLGFGDSSDAPSEAHAREHADALHELLGALAIDRVHLVGFDFGGPTAIRLASKLGGRVRSLTLAATNLFPDTPIPLPLRIAKVPVLGALFFRIAFGTLGLMMMWLAAVSDRAAFPFRRYREALGGHGVRTTRRIFLGSMRDLPGLYTEVERMARGLGLPAIVLWGDRDPFFPVSCPKLERAFSASSSIASSAPARATRSRARRVISTRASRSYAKGARHRSVRGTGR